MVKAKKLEEEERGEHVYLVLDCSNPAWSRGNQDIAPSKRCSFQLALESTIILQNAIQLFHADNSTTLVGGSEPNPVLVMDDNNAVDLLQRASAETGNTPVSITRALLMTLCAANRKLGRNTQQQQHLEIRIVLITASTVPTQDFVNCMNCAFAAQRLGITIDVLDASQSSNSPTLMQLVHHTGGWYCQATATSTGQGALAHMLLAYFAASRTQRTVPPKPIAADMRTVCFCHQRLVNVGFVCSVCLAVFCESPKFLCKACGSKVHMTMVKREV